MVSLAEGKEGVPGAAVLPGVPVGTSDAPSSALMVSPSPRSGRGSWVLLRTELNPILSLNPQLGVAAAGSAPTEQPVTTPWPRSPLGASKESVRKCWALSQIPAALPSASPKHFHLLPEGWARTAGNPVWAKSGLVGLFFEHGLLEVSVLQALGVKKHSPPSRAVTLRVSKGPRLVLQITYTHLPSPPFTSLRLTHTSLHPLHASLSVFWP